MILKTAPHTTMQGDTIQLTEQTVNYCEANNITLSISATSETQNQRKQILKLLKTLPALTTLEFRELGYMTPAARILELRRSHNIVTQFVDMVDSASVMHMRVARYVFMGNLADIERPANENILRSDTKRSSINEVESDSTL